MFRFVCQGSDKNGNPVTTSGCGEVSSAVIDLSIPLPRWGEGKSVSLNKSGSFYFTPEQEKALSKGKLPSEIIEVVNQWSSNAKFLAYGACQTKGCKHDVMIITVKES